MARYTKTFLDLGDSRKPAIQCDFLGWDDLAHGQPCTEATHRDDLDKGMTATDLGRFMQLEPGTGRTFQGIEYRRDW